MTTLFLKILTMSIVASYIAVMVIFIRLILRKAPKILSFTLWSAVLFRLVCPFSFESRISLIPSVIKTTPQLVLHTKYTFINLSTITGDSLLGNIGQSVISEIPAAAKTVGLLDIAATVWISGMIILLVYGIISYVRCRNRISTATLLHNNIYETDRIHTPFVFGFFRPRIYVLPNIADSELYYILLHEKAHISRLDHLVRPFSYIVLSVYWFNPLIWISYYMMSKDMEMACDEKVMRQVEESGRSIYSQLLLTFSAKQSGLLTPLAFGESNLKGRIRNIFRYKAPALRVTGMACILLVLIMIGLGSNPKSAADVLAKLGYDSVASQISSAVGSAAQNEITVSKEAVVDQYIENMKTENYAAILAQAELPEFAGYDPQIYNFQAYNYPETRNNDAVAKTDLEILRNQRQFIIDRFGEDAWNRATYKIVKTKCPETDGQLYYFNTATGEFVGEPEYNAIMTGYYEDLQNGIGIDADKLAYLNEQTRNTYEMMQKETGAPSTTYFDAFMFMAISMDYCAPIEIRFKDLYDCYQIFFSFNGTAETEYGENGFNILIGNKDGDFEVIRSFFWEIPVVFQGDV